MAGKIPGHSFNPIAAPFMMKTEVIGVVVRQVLYLWAVSKLGPRAMIDSVVLSSQDLYSKPELRKPNS
jgi:hypothetical protein